MNGDYLDRGTTQRRLVVVTDIELTGKEANRWEEQEQLGISADDEITYGFVGEPNRALAHQIGRVADALGQRELAHRLGWSRTRVARPVKGRSMRLGRSEIGRVRELVSDLEREAHEAQQASEVARAALRELIRRIGLKAAAADRKVDPSNLLKVLRGIRRPPRGSVP